MINSDTANYRKINKNKEYEIKQIELLNIISDKKKKTNRKR